MSADRPWLGLYRVPPSLAVPHGDALAMLDDAVARAPSRDLLRYFGASLTVADVDRLSAAFGAALRARGIARGDRVALYLQNVPQFVIALLGAWRAGAIAVPVNPMLRERELETILGDSGARALVSLGSLHEEVAAAVVPRTAVETVVTTQETDLLGDDLPPLLAGARAVAPAGTLDLLDLVRAHEGERPPPPGLGPDDVALLTYTSGTTGPPKGAMNTHGNVCFNAHAYRAWMGLGEGDAVLGIAPLFHITGMIGHVAVALAVPMPVVLGYPFDPATVATLVERHRPTFTERAVGSYIHNIYGLTETTSPSHAVPLGARAPVDPASGALSVGVPIFETDVRVVGDDGRDLPPGETGELWTRGPQVVAGYWGKPEETERALGGGWLRTGDVGLRDEAGWFYLVDRRKDMIIASGYKVWPREVEDVLYTHGAVREAAVVGVPDAYRGETVKAFVSLRRGETATAEELIAHCKARMAAYKYPRQVEILDELPKTVTGKILRRELRAR